LDRRVGNLESARTDQRKIGAVLAAQRLHAPAEKFVDIALIVGEQHIGLEIFGCGAGIMEQAGDAERHAQAIEQRKWPWGSGLVLPDAVDDLIADMRKLAGGEMPAELSGGDLAELQVR